MTENIDEIKDELKQARNNFIKEHGRTKLKEIEKEYTHGEIDTKITLENTEKLIETLQNNLIKLLIFLKIVY